MTNEDREGQSLVQADFVARRENLDLLLFEQSKLIDIGRQSAGTQPECAR